MFCGLLDKTVGSSVTVTIENGPHGVVFGPSDKYMALSVNDAPLVLMFKDTDGHGPHETVTVVIIRTRKRTMPECPLTAI